MQYSRPEIIECPNCDTLYIKNSLVSWNTFWAKIYSDGNMRAHMLPSFPIITKCNKCNEFFKINEAKVKYKYTFTDETEGINKTSNIFSSFLNIFKNTKVDKKDEIDINEKYNQALDSALDINFLTIQEILEFLDQENNDIKNEKMLRKDLWYIFNDRVKDNEKIFKTKNDSNTYNDNLKMLIKLYWDDFNTDDERLLVWEMYRNLWNFNSAKNIYQWVTNEELIPFIDILIQECENKNKLVILLS
jgi:hypothetical protein